MLKYFFLVLIIVLFAMTGMASADFHFTDRPSFSFNGGGLRHFKDFTVSGTLPVKAIDGNIGARYIRDGLSSEETTETHLRASAEGGYTWGRFGVRAYGRYGRESVMLQKGLWHGGFNVEIGVYEKGDLSVKAGLGTWAERHELIEAYQAEAADVDFGPRVHLTLKDTYWTLNSVFLLNTDKTYEVRNAINLEIPLFKILFVDQIYAAVSGSVEYYSETKHIEVDPLQWNWRHELRWKF